MQDIVIRCHDGNLILLDADDGDEKFLRRLFLVVGIIQAIGRLVMSPFKLFRRLFGKVVAR